MSKTIPEYKNLKKSFFNKVFFLIVTLTLLVCLHFTNVILESNYHNWKQSFGNLSYLMVRELQRSVKGENSLNFDRALQFINDNSYDKRVIPIKDYMIFAINKKGDIVFGEDDLSQKSGNLWRKHRKKVIYQMQKHKNGWTSYPEESSLLLSSGQWVIKYVTIDELGWIVGFQAYWPSAVTAFFSLFKVFDAVELAVIFVICFIFINAWSYRFFIRLRARIAEELEDKEIALNHEMLSKEQIELNAEESNKNLSAKNMVSYSNITQSDSTKDILLDSPIKKHVADKKDQSNQKSQNISSESSGLLKDVLTDFQQRKT